MRLHSVIRPDEVTRKGMGACMTASQSGPDPDDLALD
jgi:hypothetical protein